MTRENRYNLVFLIFILLLLVPGGVLMFISRLQNPTNRPSSESEPVPRNVAYISANPLPPNMRMVAPPHTIHWVQTVARQQIGGGTFDALLCPIGDDDLPVMSDHRAIQLIGMQRKGQDLAMWVMFWRSAPAKGEGWHTDAAEPSVTLADSKSLDIPFLVRDELGDNQIFIPPKKVLIQKLVAREPASDDGALVKSPIHLHVRLESGQMESIVLPSSPGEASATTEPMVRQ